MVLQVSEITQENIVTLMEQSYSNKRKTLADIYGKLKRGIDGVEYQKSMRNEWFF
jgi:uncharacterized protein YpbB